MCIRDSLVLCAIYEQDCVVSPVWILIGELCAELRNEETEGLCIGVCLKERAVELPIGADSQLEGDSWCNAVDWNRPCLSPHPPFLSREIRCIDPRLVEVDAADTARQL